MTIDRRSFIAATAATVAAPSFLAPRALGDDPLPPPIGSGSQRYAVNHSFLSPLAGTSWGDTHGVAQDAAGRIYLAHTVGGGSEKPLAVCVYEADGRAIGGWGTDFAGGAHGLDLRKEGDREYLYHCDTRRRCVVKTALDGTVVWTATCPMQSGVYGSASEWCPTNVAFHPGGDLFVGDGYGKGFIHLFGADGQWKKIITKPGSGKGETSCPHGLGIDPRGKEPMLVVADRGNRRIQVLALDGTPVAIHTDGVRMPCDMKFRENLMLVPDLESVVCLYDESFKPVVALGDGHPTNLRGQPTESFQFGRFVHPHDAIWLADGSILVAEWVPQGRVTRLVPVKG
ncbi:MAG: hypothetical protein FJ252_06805 [Phycisphaerae bacterium]|nr:hypothetical protein [Phycisphaerae bacterium]